jgi:DNA modification methylase
MAFRINAQYQEEKQLQLFEIEDTLQTLPKNNGEVSFSDPAFVGNKTLPMHRWVPWIAGFSSEFVRDTLNRYLDRQGIVLDPFAGVGTTLVEAILAGHRAIGFEINPYAAMACQTKLNACDIDTDKLYREIARFRAFYHEKAASNYAPISVPPKGFKTRADFYSPAVLRKVLIMHDFIDIINDIKIQDLFKLAFASTMIRYSNYSYEPSLGRRVSSGKEEILDFPVIETILHKLNEMAKDIIWFQGQMRDKSINGEIIHDSFFQHYDYVAPESVDLIITSPPYLNNYHYSRNTRPQLYWLGYAKRPQDLKYLETTNFGKYWQTTREQERVNIDFELDDVDISEQLEALRQLHPEKGIYGGNGWANYAASYFNDCYRFASGIKNVLKPGGRALVVIGNSILQGVLIPNSQHNTGRTLQGLEIVLEVAAYGLVSWRRIQWLRSLRSGM